MLFSQSRKCFLSGCRFWPLLTSLVLLVILLQVFHLALLNRLESREPNNSGSPLSGVGRQLQGRTLSRILGEMIERVAGSYRLDRSGTYHVIDNFLTSEHVLRGRSLYDVTIATQCSSQHLANLASLAKRWGGPVSVAVFTHDDDVITTVTRMLELHFCSDAVYRFVSFHLAFPISRSPRDLDRLRQVKVTCGDYAGVEDDPALVSHNEAQARNYADAELAYPNNLLRNLAINYAQTPYVFMVDVDMMPSAGLRLDFQALMTSLNTKSPSNQIAGGVASGRFPSLSAFVVPVFEIQTGVPLPSDKAQLLELWREGRARPFYWEECAKCQKLTDYDRWGHLDSKGPLSVAYSVSRDSFWEPFYIAKTSLPLYDERFKQYGFNRVSQVCEMHVSGYQFQVLNHAFLLHRGFKSRDSHHAQKEAENRRNRKLYTTFMSELKVKYPDSSRSC